MDSILADSAKLHSRMDAYEAKKDGAEAAMMDKKRKKDGEEEEGKEVEEEGDPRELKADKKADAFADADADRDEKAQIWTDAERASSSWNEAAPHPWNLEKSDEYRRRVARPHQKHSALWKGINLKELSGPTLKNVTQQIFKDSYDMSCSNEPYGGGTLREVRRVNRDTGHVIKEFYGQPMAWMQQFTGGRRLARFKLSGDRGRRD